MTDVIGVDLGGTKVAVARLHDGGLSDAIVEATELSSQSALIEQLASLVERVSGDDLDGVGVGVPSVVEFSTGRVVSSANIPLQDVPLRQVLGERVGAPVFVDNDATVAALAEAHDEQLRLVARDLVMLTIGTGVGGGLVLNGRIYRGHTGGAAEIGHTIVGLDLSAPVPQAGRFPQPASLEAAAAGLALDVLAAEYAEREPESRLGRMKAAGEEVTGVEAVMAARDGDGAAARIVELWAERVGIGIANAINIFDPQEVVIGGGAAQAGDDLIEPARRTAAAFVHPGLRGHAEIRLARHGLQSGVLGAGLLAVHELADSHAAAPTEEMTS